MAAVSSCSAATTASRLIPEGSQRRATNQGVKLLNKPRRWPTAEIRQSHHHHPPQGHLRPAPKQPERQRKIKRRPINFISTDGTTSGDECNSEDFQLPNECDISTRLEQFIKKPESSDFDEADCEDSDTVDTVSISGSIKHKNPIEGNENVSNDSKMELLNAKIRNLETVS
jgi:hypothetical protein